MAKPKNKSRIKSKTRRRQRKDDNDPKNMNTKALYLMSLDYVNMNNSNICKPDPIPYSFYDTSFYDVYSSDPPNVNKFLHCNTKPDYSKCFLSYDALNSNIAVCKDKIKKPTVEMDVSINSNIVRGYLNNIKKRDYFYKL